LSVYLKNFPESELIFDEEETKQILIFFFPNDKSSIDSATINSSTKNFVQGLLVEAVDASYQMGFVEALFRSICRFKGATDFVKTFAKKALRHWFRHIKQSDMLQVKIYESVRSRLSLNFRSQFLMMLNGVAKAKGRSQYVATKPQNYIKQSNDALWG